MDATIVSDCLLRLDVFIHRVLLTSIHYLIVVESTYLLVLSLYIRVCLISNGFIDG